MKLKNIPGILLILLVLHACNFNKSFKKDLVTGSTYAADGLGSQDVEMKVNGQITSNNTFTFADKVEFIFNNIEGLKRKKGKVYPGMSLYVVKNGVDTLLRKDDLFIEYKDGTDLNPLKLEAYFSATLPCMNNETYRVFLKIWDKKGPGFITYEMPFKVKPSEVLSIETNDISYSNIYFWNDTEKKVVTDKNIDINDEFILIIEGLDGFDLIDGIAHPALEIEIVDMKGKYVLSEKNVLESVRESGVEFTELKDGQVPVTISFSRGLIDNPCQMKATLMDLKNPAKKIVVQAELVIE